MSSIVLEPGVKDMILADCQDFICSEEWYVASSFVRRQTTDQLLGMLSEVRLHRSVRGPPV